MDDILRVLQRRYRQFGDEESARLYISALERSQGGDDSGVHPLDEILFNLLLAHLEENHGIDIFVNQSTNQLIRFLFGEENASLYRKLHGGNENRYWLDLPEMEELIRKFGLYCGHKGDCDGGDPKCEVKGCICPGCFSAKVRGIQRDLCYHHHELLMVYLPVHFMDEWGGEFDEPI